MKAVVTGAASGLGKLIADGLDRIGFDVIRFDIANGSDEDVRNPPDWISEEDVALLINSAGVNRINWLPNVSRDEWSLVMDTNARGIFEMVKACRRSLVRNRGVVLNIVSNAARVPMRASAAYNASKGAALILTQQLARELAPEVTVFSVSPNKLRDTQMSDYIDRRAATIRGWSLERAQNYQREHLLIGKETDPAAVAEFCCWLLTRRERHEYLTGCDIPYGA